MNSDPRGTNLLTYSRKQAFLTCRLKHRIAYVIGIRREPSPALRMGSAIHAALDVLKRGDELADAYEVIMANYLALINARPDYQDEYLLEREKCLRIIQGWAWRWQNSKIEMVASELPFSFRLRNPTSATDRHHGWPSHRWTVAGKIDGVCKLEDGRLALLEHKTTGSSIEADSTYWQGLEFDSQISDYMIAARQEGVEVQTVLYDVIHKPDIEPKLIPDLDKEGRRIVVDVDGQRVYKGFGEPRLSGDKTKGWKLSQRRETVAEYGERLIADIYERPQHYYARREIPRLDDDLTQARIDAWDIAKDIRLDRKRGFSYRNTSACRSPWPCPFLPVCHDWQSLLQDPLPEGFVRLNFLHPELETDDANKQAAPRSAAEVDGAAEQQSAERPEAASAAQAEPAQAEV